MLRSSPPTLFKYPRMKGKIELIGKLGAQSRVTRIRLKEIMRDSQTGEVIQGRGMRIKRTSDDLRDDFEKQEFPLVWIHYPWRRKPEPPTGTTLPCSNALKNLHGAVVQSLTPKETVLEEELKKGFNIPLSRSTNHARKHPFLDDVMKKTVDVQIDPITNKPVSASAVGFPFWYKMYPTRRHAYEYRFNIPKEWFSPSPSPCSRASLLKTLATEN